MSASGSASAASGRAGPKPAPSVDEQPAAPQRRRHARLLLREVHRCEDLEGRDVAGRGPTAIIVAGLFIISRWRGAASKAASASGEDVVVASGIFGGPTIANASQAFRGGSLTAVFGGVTLDLRSARPISEGAAITATAVFGGVEILVPRGWRLAISATPFFGGVDDKTDHSVELDPDAPLLRIDGLCVFGGIEVKHEK